MFKHIVSFSGGKDSTAMLLKMIENKMKIDEIVFCDTTVEFDEMYEHIKQVKHMIKRRITVLTPNEDFEYYLLHHEKKNGELGYGFPTMKNRWCTSLFKRDIMNKYLNKKYKRHTVILYQGIALDEIERTEKNNDGRIIKYPLIDFGMTEKDCLEYCYSKGLTWGGLYEDFDRMSCWCCPLSKHRELEVIYRKHPAKWEKLKQWEKELGKQFRPECSISDLEDKFKMG